jgi:LPXTG-site transpeptidase (sortase) family protein
VTKESDRIGTLKYSTWYINILSLIISIILFFTVNFCNSHFNFQSQNAILKAGFSVDSQNKSYIENINSNHIITTAEEEKNNWYLEIPSIELNASIAEGTTKEVMDEFIGHFEESKKWVGNVCLAAHNRGYKNNYFSEVKKLKEGDKIIYYYNNSVREYIVEKNYIIQDTDLSCLEDTEDNTITLITCVENEPNYRRCVKAIENK